MEHLTNGQLQALLGAPESKKLLELLQSSSGSALQRAAEAAKAGDYATAQRILQPALGSANVEDLAQQLKKRLG